MKKTSWSIVFWTSMISIFMLPIFVSANISSEQISFDQFQSQSQSQSTEQVSSESADNSVENETLESRPVNEQVNLSEEPSTKEEFSNKEISNEEPSEEESSFNQAEKREPRNENRISINSGSEFIPSDEPSSEMIVNDVIRKAQIEVDETVVQSSSLNELPFNFYQFETSISVVPNRSASDEASSELDSYTVYMTIKNSTGYDIMLGQSQILYSLIARGNSSYVQLINTEIESQDGSMFFNGETKIEQYIITIDQLEEITGIRGGEMGEVWFYASPKIIVLDDQTMSRTDLETTTLWHVCKFNSSGICIDSAAVNYDEGIIDKQVQEPSGDNGYENGYTNEYESWYTPLPFTYDQFETSISVVPSASESEDSSGEPEFYTIYMSVTNLTGLDLTLDQATIFSELYLSANYSWNPLNVDIDRSLPSRTFLNGETITEQYVVTREQVESLRYVSSDEVLFYALPSVMVNNQYMPLKSVGIAVDGTSSTEIIDYTDYGYSWYGYSDYGYSDYGYTDYGYTYDQFQTSISVVPNASSSEDSPALPDSYTVYMTATNMTGKDVTLSQGKIFSQLYLYDLSGTYWIQVDVDNDERLADRTFLNGETITEQYVVTREQIESIRSGSIADIWFYALPYILVDNQDLSLMSVSTLIEGTSDTSYYSDYGYSDYGYTDYGYSDYGYTDYGYTDYGFTLEQFGTSVSVVPNTSSFDDASVEPESYTVYMSATNLTGLDLTLDQATIFSQLYLFSNNSWIQLYPNVGESQASRTFLNGETITEQYVVTREQLESVGYYGFAASSSTEIWFYAVPSIVVNNQYMMLQNVSSLIEGSNEQETTAGNEYEYIDYEDTGYPFTYDQFETSISLDASQLTEGELLQNQDVYTFELKVTNRTGQPIELENESLYGYAYLFDPSGAMTIVKSREISSISSTRLYNDGETITEQFELTREQLSLLSNSNSGEFYLYVMPIISVNNQEIELSSVGNTFNVEFSESENTLSQDTEINGTDEVETSTQPVSESTDSVDSGIDIDDSPIEMEDKFNMEDFETSVTLITPSLNETLESEDYTFILEVTNNSGENLLLDHNTIFGRMYLYSASGWTYLSVPDQYPPATVWFNAGETITEKFVITEEEMKFFTNGFSGEVQYYALPNFWIDNQFEFLMSVSTSFEVDFSESAVPQL